MHPASASEGFTLLKPALTVSKATTPRSKGMRSTVDPRRGHWQYWHTIFWYHIVTATHWVDPCTGL